jgi:hypothetical protein
VKPKDGEDNNRKPRRVPSVKRKFRAQRNKNKRNRDLISRQPLLDSTWPCPRGSLENTAPLVSHKLAHDGPAKHLGPTCHRHSLTDLGETPSTRDGGGLSFALGASWSNPSRPRTATLVGPTGRALGPGVSSVDRSRNRVHPPSTWRRRKPGVLL